MNHGDAHTQPPLFPFLSRLAFTTAAIAALSTGPVVLGQAKDMGQATQYYKQNAKFKFVPGPTKKGGDVKWSVGPQGRVVLEKDEYALLENDVKILYQDITLTADKATYNMKTKDVVAEGHVIVDQGPSRLSADHAVFNLDSRTGTFFNATGSVDPSISFTGEKVEKTGERTYVLTNGVFTSCDLDKPAWSFHVKRAEITLDDYAHMQDLSFRARGIPLFWTPRLIWPTKHDRSRGFLIPRVGFSNRFGQRMELGYFIPAGDSVDTTIYADLNTKGYNGIGFDLRYLPTPDVKIGEVSGYVIHDAESNKLQWRYSMRHAQENLPGGFRGVVDVKDFSDLDFFRTYDRDPTLHTLSQIYSSAYLTKNRSNFSLNLLTDRRDILLGRVDPNDPNSDIRRQRYEQLPSVQFRTYPDKIGDSPFYFSMESSASHLVTSGVSQALDANYYRADVFPTLSMQLRTPAWLSIKPQISVRETYYTSSLTPLDASNPGEVQSVDTKSVNRFYGQAQVEVVGPSFSKVYNDSAIGFTKFKHVIEPRIRYIHTTNVDDQDRVIRFDTVDSPFFSIVGDSVEYSLTQRLIGKEAGATGNSREVLSFSLRQTASLSKPFTSSTGGTLPSTSVSPGENKFTPLVASLHVNPYQSLTLDANTTFGNVSHQLDQSSLSANFVGTGKNTDKYLSFSWFSTYLLPGQPVGTDSSQIRINSGSSILRDRLRADIEVNYDIKKRSFLEERYLLGANGSCYGIALEYRHYLIYDPVIHPINSLAVSVTLKNVGTISTH